MDNKRGKLSAYFLDKRGAEMTTNTIILIILGVAILVILIIGFTYVWGGLGKRIAKDNIATIVSACQTSCTTGSVYDFCSKQIELIDEENKKIKTSCQVLAYVSDFTKYGLESCPAIECKVACTDLKINNKPGVSRAKGGVDPATHYYLTDIAYGLNKIENNCSIAK